MKISILALFLASATESFAPTTSFRRIQTNLHVTRPDTSDAVKKALEISKQYGATSPEARVAWDAVEEMDASDNSVAYKPSLDQECELDADGYSKACEEYEEKLQVLQEIIDSNAIQFQKIKEIASEMESIKMSAASSAPSVDSPQLREAMEYARKMQQEHGADSQEARVAWTEVEEIASTGLSNAMGRRLDEECLVEYTQDACRAIEALNNALNLQKTRNDSGLNA